VQLIHVGLLVTTFRGMKGIHDFLTVEKTIANRMLSGTALP